MEAHNILKILAHGEHRKNDTLVNSHAFSSFCHLVSPLPFFTGVIGDIVVGAHVLKQSRETSQEVGKYGHAALATIIANTKQMQTSTNDLLIQFRKCVNLFHSASKADIQSKIREHLDIIGNTCNGCIEQIMGIENSFVNFNKMMKELLSQSSGKGSQSEEKAKSHALMLASNDKENWEREKDERAKARNMFLSKAEETENFLIENFEALPMGIPAIALSSACVEKARTESSMSASTFGEMSQMTGKDVDKIIVDPEYFPNLSRKIAITELSEREGTTEKNFSLYRSLEHGCQLHALVEALFTLATEGKVKKGIRHPQWEELKNRKVIEFFMRFFDHILTAVSKMEPRLPTHEHIIGICERAAQYGHDLMTMANSNQENESKIKEIQKGFEALLHEARTIYAQSRVFCDVNPLFNGIPFTIGQKRVYARKREALNEMADASSKQLDSDLHKVDVENCHFNLNLASKIIDRAQGRWKIVHLKLGHQNEHMISLLRSKAEVKAQAYKAMDLRKSLIHGIDASIMVRHQWGKLAMYFQKIMAIAHCIQEITFLNFYHTKEGNIFNHTPSNIYRDLLVTRAMEGFDAVHVLQQMLTKVFDLSHNYVEKNTKLLHGLIILNPERMQTGREHLLKEIQISHAEMKGEIDSFGEHVEKVLQRRKSNIQTLIHEKLPILAREIASKIKNAIQRGALTSEHEQLELLI